MSLFTSIVNHLASDPKSKYSGRDRFIRTMDLWIIPVLALFLGFAFIFPHIDGITIDTGFFSLLLLVLVDVAISIPMMIMMGMGIVVLFVVGVVGYVVVRQGGVKTSYSEQMKAWTRRPLVKTGIWAFAVLISAAILRIDAAILPSILAVGGWQPAILGALSSGVISVLLRALFRWLYPSALAEESVTSGVDTPDAPSETLEDGCAWHLPEAPDAPSATNERPGDQSAPHSESEPPVERP